MGTNFHAKIIPSKERKKELHDAIDNNDFSLIEHLINELYGEIHVNYDNDDIEGGKIHLGKRSGGWKFLWNPNIFQIKNGHTEWDENHRFASWIQEPDTAKYLYPLTKEGIKTFINREDIEIYDEYKEKQDKKEFWEMALNWTTWNGTEAWDSDSYHKEYPNEYNWSCKNSYTDFLESLGYKLSKNKSDFYSDGLRFSTTTEFG